jgi:hypothetical protein
MKPKLFLFALATFAITLPLSVLAQTQVTFEVIASFDYPGARGSNLGGINEAGDVVGGYTDNNQSMTPTPKVFASTLTPLRCNFSLLATALCRLSRSHQVYALFIDFSASPRLPSPFDVMTIDSNLLTRLLGT